MRQWLTGLMVLLVWGCGGQGPAPTALEPIKDKTRADAPAPDTFANPIIPGFAPDPSVVRVGKDFYLVNSSFEYFPGLPIYHSTDLVNWALIGNALDNPKTADLDTVDASGGIHAATIRYHDGLFYIATTTIVHDAPVSFIITATDPKGPWSDPVVVEGAEGIDPSLFFDDDGRVWYHANRHKDDPSYTGESEIWLQELDLETLQLIGPRTTLWTGCCQGGWEEGPHIYKRDGLYYLLLSEGGTSYKHAIAVAVSEAVDGPYQNNPRNPVLTHRHLSYDYPIMGVGHADMVELADGRWYAVALGWRLMDRAHGLLGRETFLLPVTWETEREWWIEQKWPYPVFSPQTGRIEHRFPLPFNDQSQAARAPFVDQFDSQNLGPEWNMRRSRSEPFTRLEDGALVLSLSPAAIANRVPYSFIGIRQRDFAFGATTKMAFTPDTPAEEAGVMVIQKDEAAIALTVRGDGDAREAILWQTLYGERTILATRPFPHDTAHIRIDGDKTGYRFFIGDTAASMAPLGGEVDGTILSPNILKGFNYTGVYLGLYGSSNGTPTDETARFDHFTYTPVSGQQNTWFDWPTEK